MLAVPLKLTPETVTNSPFPVFTLGNVAEPEFRANVAAPEAISAKAIVLLVARVALAVAVPSYALFAADAVMVIARGFIVPLAVG